MDGEIQIAWVLEQGLVDMAFIERTFGIREVTREQFITRGPRFQITFDANAAELNTSAATKPRSDDELARLGPQYYSLKSDNQFVGGSSKARRVKGRYELQRCKPDSVSLGIMPGRRVAAVRWEGVAEGIRFIPDQSIQEFKEKRLSTTTTQQSQSRGTLTDVTNVNRNVA